MSQDDNKTASVELDRNTLMAFESHLRNSLVSSQFMLAAENKAVSPNPSPATVTVDAATVARLSESLRNHLVSSNVMSAEENETLNSLTNKVK